MTEPQGFFSHYKRPDRYYYVLACAINRTTDTRSVVYISLYDAPNIERVHVRTIEEFTGSVWVGDNLIPRFTAVASLPMELLHDFGQVMADMLNAALQTAIQ